MIDSQVQSVRVLYGEILGIFIDLPNPNDNGGYTTPASVVSQFNACMKEIQEITGENLTRYLLSDTDRYHDNYSNSYVTAIVRPRVGSAVRRLEAQYGFNDNNHEAPLIITVHNTNQVTVTVKPIQEIIQSESDEEVKNLLIELREALNTDKKSEKTSSILTTLQQKSWEVFIKVLPYVLEQLGKNT